MTSRGNPSISPPAQISQQRHVTAIPSGTPPPQHPQFFPGQTPLLQPQSFEFYPQTQAVPQHQAYGSALNDARVQLGSGGRPGAPQQNLPQGGGNYYQPQEPANMRQQQPQQGPMAQPHQYFISTQGPQAGMRPRHQHPAAQGPAVGMMYINPSSMVIPPGPQGVYQSRMPAIYPRNAPYTGVMIAQQPWPHQNLAQVPMQQNPRPQPPTVREKKILTITDPNSGVNVTDEILKKRMQANEMEENHDESQVNQNDNDIRKLFARQVAQLAAPSTENQNSAGGGPAISGNAAPSSQYQQPPPMGMNQMMRPPMSGPPPNMVPHMPRPTLMQTPPTSATPPEMQQHAQMPPQMPQLNLSMPPPNMQPNMPLRQPTPAQIYNPQQQQQAQQQQQQQQQQQPPHGTPHHGPRHPQQQEPQQPQHGMRPPMPHVMHGGHPQQMAQAQFQQQAPQQAPQPSVHMVPAQEVVAPPQQIAPKPDPAPVPTAPAEPSKPRPLLETVAVPPQSIPPASAPLTSPPAVAKKTPSPPAKEESPAPVPPPVSAPSAPPKQKEPVVENKPVTPAAPAVKETTPPPAVPVATPPAEEAPPAVKEEPPKEEGATTQIVKDGKRGKKGKKEYSRKEIGGSDMDAFIDGKDNELTEVDAKPPLPPQAGERKNSQAGALDNKATASPSAALPAASSPKEKTPEAAASKKASPPPEIVAEVKKPVEQSKVEEEKTPPPPPKKEESPPPSPSTTPSAAVSPMSTPPSSSPSTVTVTTVATTPASTTSTTITTTSSTTTPTPSTTPAPASTVSAPAKNQNQAQATEPEESIRSGRRLPGQTGVQQSSQPLDNGIPEDGQETVPVDGGSDKGNHQPYNDENKPPKDLAPSKQKDDDKEKRNAPSSGAKDDGVPSKPNPNNSAVKKEGKEKLQYDRAYLMELRGCASSQTKPDGLPNLEIILDRPVMNSNRGTSMAPMDFTPSFFQPNQGNQRHAQPIGKSSSRGRQRPGEMQMAQRVIKSVSIQSDVKPLHQSEKPWKPTPKQMSAGELAEKKKTLESEVLFIMNRLTPTNFERLAAEMRRLDIKTYDDLTELVKIFFDKVTMETKFVEAYALLCKIMSGLRVQPPPNLKDSQATFRVVMLTKCQQEFEADKSVVFEDPEAKKKQIEAEQPEGPERQQLIEDTLYQMKLKRLKFYGNIRFIGELFKLGMLTENIMHDCIYRLLKARDDDSLVSLCNLVSTVGEALDTEKAKARMNQYFAQMEKIADERKSRIKFTLKDVIDLRSNNWVPRKEKTGPKKIDEVHKDFQQEQVTKQFLQSQPPPPRNDPPQPGSRRGSRQRDDKPNDDGWNTVGSKSIRIDASKMKLSKQNVVDENSIQLGPGGGMNKFSMWSRGSFGGAQPSQDDRPSPTPNRFSALRADEDRRNFQRSPSRGESNVANRGMRQGPTAGHGRGKILSRSSTEGERRDALASARNIVGGRSQNSSRDNSWNREDRRHSLGPRGSREGDNPMTRSDISLRPSTDSLLPPSAAPPSAAAASASFGDTQGVKKLKPMSEAEMEHKAKQILEEYLNIRDMKEAKLCMMELEGQQYMHVLVTACLNDVLERSAKDRDLTGHFFHEMVKDNLLSLEAYTKGLSEVMQIAEDMVIDIPMIWSCLAQLLTPLLVGNSLPWQELIAVLKSSISSLCCAKLLAEILLTAKEKTSENDAAALWQSSGLQWSAFLASEDVEKFLQDKKIQFVNTVSASSSQMEGEKVAEDVEKMLQKNCTSQEIIAHINKTIPAEKIEKTFIRALTTVVAKASISSTPPLKVNEELFRSRKDVLSSYINNPEQELQALYAIQALMHRLEHPSGVIMSLFDLLFDEDVINEATFKQWEKSTDLQEQEGKGPCCMQLTQFFAWLQENEEPETS